MKKPVLKTVDGDGIKLTVASWKGIKDSQTILCIHGLAANCRSWDVFGDLLSPEYNVIAVDLRGRGSSDRPDTGYGLDQHSADIKCILNNLQIDKVSIISHSFGGFVSLVFAAQNPDMVKKIVNIDGGIELPPDVLTNITPFVIQTFERLGKVYPTFDDFFEGAQQNKLFQPWSPVVESMYRHDMEETDKGVESKTQISHIQQDAVMAKNYNYDELYKKVKCPILAMRSTEPILTGNDIVIPESLAQDIVAKFPNAREIPIKGTNHISILFQENKERDQALINFFEEA